MKSTGKFVLKSFLFSIFIYITTFDIHVSSELAKLDNAQNEKQCNIMYICSDKDERFATRR